GALDALRSSRPGPFVAVSSPHSAKGADLKRFIVSAAVAALALAFAGSALASYTPKIVVSQAGTKTTIHVTIAKDDDATLKLTIYAPSATPATLTQAPGTPIGTVSAQVNAKAISPDAILPLTGIVQVADGTAAPLAFGAGKLQVCLPSPDVPQSAGGAAFGAKLLDVNFTVDGIFAASTSPLAIWPSVFTPYVPGTATPNPAGTVLALGIEAQPTLTLT